MYNSKRTKNGPLRNSSITLIFLIRFSIQNHSKPSTTKKGRNNTNYLTWNLIRIKFVKKTSMPNSVESLGYIKCYSLSSPRPVKIPCNCIRHNCEKICSWLRRPKTIVEIRKKSHLSRWSTIWLFTSFSKTLLATERRITG